MKHSAITILFFSFFLVLSSDLEAGRKLFPYDENCWKKFAQVSKDAAEQPIKVSTKEKLKDWVIEKLEAMSQFVSNNKYEGRVMKLYHSQDRIDYMEAKVGKKIAHGAFGVVYHVEIIGGIEDGKAIYPSLFDDGEPTKKLVIKFPNRVSWVPNKFNVWRSAIKKEAHQSAQVMKYLGDDTVKGAEILFAQSNSFPFIIKPLITATPIQQVAKEQKFLTTEQLESLEKDIFKKALQLWNEHEFALDLKVENLAWDEERKTWLLYETTQAYKNSTWFIQDGFEGYVEMVQTAMRRFRN